MLGLSSEQKARFASQGFLCLSHESVRDITKTLRIEMQGLARTLLKDLGLHESGDVREFEDDLVKLLGADSARDCTRICYELFPALPCIIGLLNHEFFLQVAKSLGVDKPIASANPIVRIDRPSEKTFLTPIHQDSWFSMVSDSSLTFWFPLTRHLSEMGPLEIIPGSHSQGMVKMKPFDMRNPLTVDNDLPDELFEPLFLDQNQILVFDQNLIHRSTINQSVVPRVTCQVRFNSGSSLNTLASSFVVKSSEAVKALQKRNLSVNH